MSSKSDSEKRRLAWTNYWAQGASHSCVGSFGGSYSGAIGAFWSSLFDVCSAPIRLLDLAAGNGPVARLAWERWGRGAGLEVDAVDLAKVAPAWYRSAEHLSVRFHSGVSIENLPFEDASFDCVVSQFGIEYAARPKAFLEALRVAKPGAIFGFVMHHADSVLADVARHEAANADFLLGGGGLFAAAEEVLPWLGRIQAGTESPTSPGAVASRDRYNKAMQALTHRIEAANVPDMLVEARGWVHELLGRHFQVDVTRKLERLQLYRAQVEAAGLRSAELVRFALRERDTAEIAEIFRQALPDSPVLVAPLIQREGLLAWSLRTGG